MTTKRLISLFTAAGAVWLSGCASERPAIDRVQPNVVDKSTLVDDWYYGRTVVEVPAGDGLTFVGATDFNGLVKIRWDVQENFLYARRTYELVKDADSLGRHGERYEGEVVAAYKVESHFDIQRQYNPSTGEELNVREENTVDRPWYERKYMRVDWSQNLALNYNLEWEATSVEPIPYFVQEIDPQTGKRHRHAPHFEKDASGQLTYFDITNRLYAKSGAELIEGYEEYGPIPLCWLRDFTECGTSEYTIRHSFMKIDPRHEYVPKPYKGKATEVFGFFWSDRQVYDPRTGIRVQGLERYINRHNIWESWFDLQGKPMRLSGRKGKPIVYYVNQDWPKDDVALLAAARSAADQWNTVFTDVVQAAGAQMPDNGRMFILCEHNPVEAGDPPECGNPGLSPRLGDIRYSFLAYVPDYMKYGLLGLGPSNNDPETGEIISGMAYVYHWNNIGAFNTAEMVQLLNGTKDPETFIAGMDITQWIDQVRSGQGAQTYSLAEADALISRVSSGPHVRYWDASRRAPSAADEEAQRQHGVRAWTRPFLDDMYRRGIDRQLGVAPEARLSALAGTEIEQMLLDDEILLGMGFDPNLPVSEEMKDRASILRGGFGKFAAARERFWERFAESKNMYLPEMADDALMGLALEYKDSHKSLDEIIEDLRRRIYTAVLTHESGHSLGLMHNFGGSDDAINYFDEYWETRAQDGTVGPRLVDPITPQEIRQNIYNDAYSSIMDYAGRYTVDGRGLGKYDRAAMLYGYADKVEVFQNTHGIRPETFREWFESDGDIINFWTVGPEAVHYTSFYNSMGEDLYAASNRVLVDELALSEDWSAAGSRVRVPYIYCSHSRSDLGDSCLTRDSGADAAERMQNILDDLETWYITRSFPRGQIGVDQWGYVGRYYGRIYNRLKQWHDMYGLYKDFLPRYYDDAQLAAFYSDPVNGWGTKTWAVQNAFNYLVRTILMPEVGGYDPMTQPDGSVMTELSPYESAALDLGITDARYYSTSWWDSAAECGYMWWECLHHIGFYLDKIMAIEALSDAETNFVGRSTPEDIREWKVSYYNTFADQIGKISEALMEQRWDTVAPYVEGGEVKFPNYAGELTEVHASPVNPMATFTVQLYWQVLGRARFVSNFDASFDEAARIFEMGTGMQPELPAGELTTFRDPFSGISYGAIDNPLYQGGGAATIRRANMLLARSTMCDDAAATTTLDDDCVPPDGGYSTEQLTAMLRGHVDLVRAMVRIESVMHWGNPYDP